MINGYEDEKKLIQRDIDRSNQNISTDVKVSENESSGGLITDKIISLLNYRLNEEEYSSRLYKSMANYLRFNGNFGAAKLYDNYSQEELEHAKWVYDYMQSMNIMPEIREIRKPDCEFESVIDVYERAYNHEIEITKQCLTLAKTCKDEDDFMTMPLAHKYINEQRDEIAKAKAILDRVKAFGGSDIIMYEIDESLLEGEVIY